MEYFIGAGLALIIGAFATAVGFERDRAFYPTILVVIAAYYDLFAIMAGSTQALGPELVASFAFVIAAVVGFRFSLWVVVAALAAHGTFDIWHAEIIENPGVPAWWPMFCSTYDLTAAGYLGWRLIRAGEAKGVNVGAVPRPAIRASLAALITLPTRPSFRRVFSAIALAGLAIGAAAFASPASDVRTAQADGHSVAYRVAGSSRPVVVMISGLGDGMSSFDAVTPELAKSATVITYDRAGYGHSPMTSGPRDAAAAERELAGLLAQSGIRGPYVLVGHSLGGMFAEYYAAKHPEQIAGLILEETRPAEFTRTCETSRISMCAPTVAMMQFAPRGARAETAALADTASEVEGATPVVGKPVLVLSRFTPPNAKPFDALWARLQTHLAARYPGSTHLTAPAGGHYVHRDQKAWFVSAVRSFL